MRIAVVYVYPQVRMSVYYPLAKRFADTWKDHPPQIGHDLYVVLNGGISAPIDRAPFNDIPAHHFVTHSNMGWDIGAYQRAAEAIPADMMVYLGAPTHFYRDGWLERMADAFIEHSPGLFGCWGICQFPICRHIRTTAFWCDPKLLQAYPFEIGNGRGSRYDFEHGHHSFTTWSESAGFPPLMVTFDRCYAKHEWDNADGGFDKCLVYDQFIQDPNSKHRIRNERVAFR